MIPRPPKAAILGVASVAALGTLAMAWNVRDGEIPPARRKGALQAQDEILRRQKNNLLMGLHRGSIRGRVTLDDRANPAGIVVRARFRYHATGATGEGVAVVRADGSYEIRALDSREFVLTVENAAGYIPPPPLSVDLRGKTLVSGANLDLRLGPLVTVRVREAITGAPVSGLLLTAADPRFGPAYGEGVPTDAKGEAALRAEALDLTLHLEDPTGRYAGVETPGLYRSVALPRSNPFHWDLRVYDTRGPREATFRGVVLKPNGRPAAGAKITFYRYAEVQRATAGPDGAYAFKAPRIEWPDLQNGSGAILIAEEDGLRAVRTVPASDAWSPARVVLAPDDRATLVGRIVDERGRPLAGCPISYSERYPTFGSGSSSGRSAGVSGPDGRFRVAELDPRAFHSFTFGGPTGTYPGSPGPLGTTEIPKYISNGPGYDGVYQPAFLPLKPRERRDLGDILVPHAGHEVSGVLVTPDGAPMKPNVVVVLEGDHTSGMDQPDAKGRFRFENVVDEPLELRVATGIGDEHGWGGDPRRNSPDILLRRSVRAGATDLRLVATFRPPKPR